MTATGAGANGRSAPVLVIGGGIGGLTAALALTRRGRRAVVLERAPEFVELGAGLQVGPNAVRVLAALGALDPILRSAVQPRRLVIADVGRDEDLISLDLGDRFLQRYEHPYLVMHRHDLLSALVACCRDAGVELHAGVEVTDVDDSGHDVVVRTAEGEEHRGAGVVGADGLWSCVRSLLVGDELVEEPYVAYRGTTERASASTSVRADSVVMWVGAGVHFVQYALRAGALVNQVAVFRSPSFGSGDPAWGTPDELEAAFAGAGRSVRDGLLAIGRDRRWPMLHRRPVPAWGRGRITLLGDAAHPMLQYVAQGACQAIEDAYCLAAALDAADDVEQGFQLYELARRPRTAVVQDTARSWGEVCHVDGIGRSVLDALFQRIGPDPYEDLDWLYGYDATARPEDLAAAPAPSWSARSTLAPALGAPG